MLNPVLKHVPDFDACGQQRVIRFIKLYFQVHLEPLQKGLAPAFNTTVAAVTKVRWCQLQPGVESAWCEIFELKYDKPLSRDRALPSGNRFQTSISIYSCARLAR